jgi:hypothetical protein
MKLLGKSAGTKTLNGINSLPRMAAAFYGWGSTLLLVKITQQIVDGFVQDIAQQIPFHGVVQPLSPKQLMLKPEGERAWTWLQIHVQASSPVKLTPNDRVMYNCQKYKIMARLDYSANNYVEYHAVEDFQ